VIDILSFGGGVGSWGYAALVAQGKIRAPWMAAIVDTGREITSTWEYIERHRSALTFDLHIIKQPLPSLWSGNGNSFLPGGFDIEGGAFMRGFCSSYWKRDVMRRWLVKKMGITAYNLAFGIHFDEWQRMTSARQKSVINIYPLVDLKITRADCAQAALDVFGEIPPRSRCWMCPGQNTDDWEEVTSKYPELYKAALEIDTESRARANISIFGKYGEPPCGGQCYV